LPRLRRAVHPEPPTLETASGRKGHVLAPQADVCQHTVVRDRKLVGCLPDPAPLAGRCKQLGRQAERADEY
jgi:hypothetical protein